MMSIRKFQLKVPGERLRRLKQKLELTDFPDEALNVEDWSRGTPSSDIKRLARYWANGFDWREAEAKLNSFPQYLAAIEVENFGTFDIHFIHQLSANPNAIPLLFLHGWPGSFIEATKILPKLVYAGTDKPSFHVVAPDLVGFGFSSSSKVCRTTSLQHMRLT